MQKKLLKCTLLIGIMILFALTVNCKAMELADPISNEEVLENDELESELDEEDDEASVGSTSEDDTIGPTQEQASSTRTVTTSQVSQPSKTYSTVATIPEANLSLNNILNVILIAVGVIIILLAIAILIRLK